MTDSLADQIRAQAAISARPGQLVALEALAAQVAEVEHERDVLRQMLRAAAVQLAPAQRLPLGYEDFAATINQQADRIAKLERERDDARGVLSCIGPVSGYVVAIDEPVGMDLPEGFRQIIRDEGDARDAVNMLRYNDPEAGPTVTYRMFELREVQP
ncbi:hypothetical protein LTT66_18150 [Nocardia gipuzkoensis]|uniref:hypothetical protein n=1 Tax=Nocardia gipuzkoensis TaxID=2749991 RepID=UPI001E4C2C19|nr:hypothetical protein [Nocardia gipuzkoensis]UGT65292.1 hypothetical protein LTT66_18150 [Nocardia gipuzkoensis]